MYSPHPVYSPLITRRRLPPTPVDGSPLPTHRRLCEVRSAAPFEMPSPLLAAPMRQPLRSQSFKHRPKPLVEVKRSALEDVSVERRRSTPTVSRRCSLQAQKGRLIEPRTDVWPEARVASEAEERFLKLPDAEDYTRVRQFNIDKKGAVVSRGDSFRRKKTTKFAMDKSPSPYITSGSDSARDSRSGSPSSSDDGVVKDFIQDNGTARTSHNIYKIYVVGETGTGKSSLIAQLITSEYRNAFADEIQDFENTVSICIGGQECDLIFFENDLADPTWLTDVQAFVVIYSIDSRSTWKSALNAIEMARNSSRCQHIPILVAGNKADLERKRTVSKNEVRSAAAQFGFETFEISVALNHNMDDLLVGLVAEIQEAFAIQRDTTPTPRVEDDFHAAIRRYSMRKKKEVPEQLAPGKCTSLTPAGIFARLKNWRRPSIPSIQT